jgi:hypothetical protein
MTVLCNIAHPLLSGYKLNRFSWLAESGKSEWASML